MLSEERKNEIYRALLKEFLEREKSEYDKKEGKFSGESTEIAPETIMDSFPEVDEKDAKELAARYNEMIYEEKARDIVKTFVEKGEVTEEEMQSFVNDLEQEQDRGEKEEDKDKDKDGEEQGE